MLLAGTRNSCHRFWRDPGIKKIEDGIFTEMRKGIIKKSP